MIYPVDNAIQHLNNWDQVIRHCLKEGVGVAKIVTCECSLALVIQLAVVSVLRSAVRVERVANR